MLQSNDDDKNYIGQLQEFAAKLGDSSYPLYNLAPVPMQGQFVIKCTFLGHETHGVGRNKKSAKRESAKNMLKIIRPEGSSVSSSKNVLTAGPDLSVDSDSLEAVEKELKKNDIAYVVEWIQSNLYTATLTFEETKWVSMGVGKTKNQALKNAFKELFTNQKILIDMFLKMLE